MAPSDLLPFPGTERFELERELGAGGMGVVYAARDRRTDARVALKTLRTLDAESLSRLKTEFRALQEVEHPNLVSLGELIETDGHWFFTMELVEGVPLLEFVRGDERRVRDAFGQLALALAALHGAGLIHRDVKPSNALVTRAGRVVLLDFGLVRDVRGRFESMHDNIVGTAAYMAPEQATEKRLTPAADWYAFGVTLFEALTGELPYEGSPIQILLAKQQQQAATPRQRAPQTAADLDALCSALLAFDPATRPDAAAVMHALDVKTSTPSSASFSGSAEVVGRETELAALRAGADARSGEGAQAMLVRGASGLGKSALVERFLAELRAGDTNPVILSGRCYPNESVPFKALDGVVDALAAELLRMGKEDAAVLVPRNAALLPVLFPALWRVEVIARSPAPRRDLGDPLEQRTRAFAAMRELLVRIARRRPLVVHIDDLHWSDDDSVRLLDELLRPPEAPSLLLVATMRDGYEPPTLPCPTLTVDLGPLEEPAARRVAARVLDRVGARGRVSPDAIAIEARGHPLHIEELARHAADTGSGSATDAAPKLDDAIWARIGRLSDDARRLVELVAIAASPLPEEVLLTAAELPASDFSRCVSTLRVSHLVKSGDHGRRVTVQPYHDRVRESITARLSAEDQRERHRRLAIALELAGEPDLERLAGHLRGAGENERAASVMFDAAEQAVQKTAFGRAARLYQETLALFAADHPRRAATYARLGDALANAGRGPQAASAYREALAGHRGPDQLVLQRKVAEQLLRSGHSDEGLGAIAELARAGGMELAPTARRAIMRFLVARARIALRGYRFVQRDEREVPASELARIDTAWALAEALSFSDFAQGALFHAVGTLAALEAGEPRRLVRAFIGEAINLSVDGIRAQRRYSRAVKILDELLKHIDDPELHAAARAAMGLIAIAEGRFSDSLEAGAAAEDAYRAAGSRNRFQMTGTQSLQVWSLSMLGRVRDATGRVPELLRDARDRGDLHTETTLSLSTAYWIPLLADRPDDAMALVDEALSHWSKRSMQLQHMHGLHARINVELYRGNGERAFEELERVWPDVERSMLLRHELTRTRAWELRGRAALAAARSGANPAARRVVRRSLRALRRTRTIGAPGLRALLESGLAAVAGDRTRAAADLDRALTDLAEMNQWRRSARWALGQLRGGADGEAAATTALDEIAMEGAVAPARFLSIFVPWFTSA